MNNFNRLYLSFLGRIPGAIDLNTSLFGHRYYRTGDRKYIFELIKKIKREKTFLLTNREAYQLYSLVKSLEKTKGDIAEVGVFQGGSAKLICELKGKKN